MPTPPTRRAFIKSITGAVGAAALISTEIESSASASNDAEARLVSSSEPSNEKLWYSKPASNWLEALPIGNGRIAAMVFGGTESERLQLNEGTIWAGGPHDYTSPDAHAALPEIRKLVFDGQWKQAQDLANAKLVGRPSSQASYQTVGNLVLNFHHTATTTDYKRELDLKTAICSCAYTSDGVRFTREAFASVPGNVIVVRLTASKPGSISLTVLMDSPQRATIAASSNSKMLTLDGKGGDGGGTSGKIQFQAAVQVVNSGGTTSVTDNSVEVTKANSVTLLIAMASNYTNFESLNNKPAEVNSAVLTKVSRTTFAKLRQEHVENYQKLYNRVSLNLGESKSGHKSTDLRVADYGKGNDPQLAALHFQYGRYLLISCSRPSGQPATLQGLWNDSVSPPWGSKYTININTEMNYWPAGPANLLECYEPLVAMLRDLTVTGAKTAKDMYGAKGWVCHHNTNGWRGTAPVDGSFWGMWPMGGAWLCKSLWDSYEYSGDAKLLRDYYPLLKGAITYFMDALVTEPTHGWLVTCPSISPEHGHHPNVSICAGPTMDIQILNDLFDCCIRASELLKQDADLRDTWKQVKAKFPPMQIGKAGQLQEWLEDWDLTAEEINHRHVSHLYGLYPSDQITKRHTPELFAAARKSLEMRGDVSTGWSLAWKINLWARLEDGERAHKLLGYLLTPERTAPNLFDLHPPFQIDGNFGAVSGIAEMLISCRNGEIFLLPALPAAWATGSIKGLRARGGYTVDLSWKSGALAGIHVVSNTNGACTLRFKDKSRTFPTTIGARYNLGPDLEQITNTP